MVVVDGVECCSCGSEHTLHVDGSSIDGSAMGQSWYRFICPATGTVTEGRMAFRSQGEGGARPRVYLRGERLG